MPPLARLLSFRVPSDIIFFSRCGNPPGHRFFLLALRGQTPPTFLEVGGARRSSGTLPPHLAERALVGVPEKILHYNQGVQPFEVSFLTDVNFLLTLF